MLELGSGVGMMGSGFATPSSAPASAPAATYQAAAAAGVDHCAAPQAAIGAAAIGAPALPVRAAIATAPITMVTMGAPTGAARPAVSATPVTMVTMGAPGTMAAPVARPTSGVTIVTMGAPMQGATPARTSTTVTGLPAPYGTPVAAAPAGAAPAAPSNIVLPIADPQSNPIAALDGVIAQREKQTAAARVALAAEQASGPAGAARAALEAVIVDADEATTRRLKGLEISVKSAVQLTPQEMGVLRSIVTANVTPGVPVSEQQVVTLQAVIEQRLGRLSTPMAVFTAKMSESVQARQRSLAASVSGALNGVAALDTTLAPRLAEYNELTNQLGTTMVKLQQLGAKVTDLDVQLITTVAQAIKDFDVDPKALLSVMQATLAYAELS